MSNYVTKCPLGRSIDKFLYYIAKLGLSNWSSCEFIFKGSTFKTSADPLMLIIIWDYDLAQFKEIILCFTA